MKKFLIIRDSKKLIRFKNREIRTPATLKVSDKDLKQLHIALRMADIQDFEVTTEEPTKIESSKIFVEENKEVVVEELEVEEEEPSTILEELMRNGEKL